MSVISNGAIRRTVAGGRAVALGLALVASVASGAPPEALRSKSLGGLRCWPGKGATVERQTIWFELDVRPGQVFRIVVPELVSDDSAAYLPWGHPSYQAAQLTGGRFQHPGGRRRVGPAFSASNVLHSAGCRACWGRVSDQARQRVETGDARGRRNAT